MPTTYRMPRPGDIVTVRTNDPHLDEVTVTIDRIGDDGDIIFLAGAWGHRDLEVLIRRVGQPTLNFLEH